MNADQTIARSRLEILQMRFDAVAQGMQETLFRTAVSPVVREGADASCALFTAAGELLALSDAIPLLLGALPGSVKAILARYPAQDMSEGDMFFMNDPFAGGSWALWGPGQAGSAHAAIRAPAGRLFFAGEHTAEAYRGMEAAMESGERAALEIMRALA